MGDARRRGTYEERKKIAIEKHIVYQRKKELERQRIEASKTPEDRAREAEIDKFMLEMLLLFGMSGYYNKLPRL